MFDFADVLAVDEADFFAFTCCGNKEGIGFVETEDKLKKSFLNSVEGNGKTKIIK